MGAIEPGSIDAGVIDAGAFDSGAIDSGVIEVGAVDDTVDEVGTGADDAVGDLVPVPLHAPTSRSPAIVIAPIRDSCIEGLLGWGYTTARLGSALTT